MAAHYLTRLELNIAFFSASRKPHKSVPMDDAANNHTENSRFKIQDSNNVHSNISNNSRLISGIWNLESGI
jgi:hypothetical protein